jgi:hypothetical protein
MNRNLFQVKRNKRRPRKRHNTPPLGPNKKGQRARLPLQIHSPRQSRLQGHTPAWTLCSPKARSKRCSPGNMTAGSEPLSPTREFAEDAKQIYLVLTSELATAASVQASLIVVSVEGRQPNHKLGNWALHLTPGQRGITTLKLTAPEGGLSPGDYRMDLAVNGGPAQSLPFTVVPLFPPAVLAEQTEVPRGFNIALTALGGKVEGVTSEYNDKTWAAANLIDGAVSIREGGWSSKDHTLPQDLVFSFYQTREALITAVVIDTTTPNRDGVYQLLDGRIDTPGWRSADRYLPQEFVFAFRGDQVALIDQIILHPKTPHDPTTWPKRITVSVSPESPLDGFQEVGQFTLQQEPREQAFPIGRRARS